MSLKTFQVGDKVMLDPEVEGFTYGKGWAEYGAVGVVKQIDDDGDLLVNFPNHESWLAKPEDLIHAKTQTEGKTMTENPNEALVKIMWAKQIEFGPAANYFTVEDANDIMEWKTEDAEEVLLIMKRAARRNVPLLGPHFCPFCIKHGFYPLSNAERCTPCEYGARHGICPLDEHPDYRIAVDLFNKRTDKPTPAEILDRLGVPYKEECRKKEEKKQKPIEVKRFEDREPDDHPKQMYLRLEAGVGPGRVTLVLVDKDGQHVTAPNVVTIDSRGITRASAVNPNAPFALDDLRRIMLDE